MPAAQLTKSGDGKPLRQSRREEIVNSITHGLGVPLSIAALVILLVQASHHTAWHVVSVSIFGASLILLYLASCVYHAVCAWKPRRVFQVLDHAFIFVLIAGTYTPFALVNLRGPFGWTLFGIVWAMAIGGIVLKAILLPRYEKSTSAIYVAMGWLSLLAIFELVAKVPTAGVVWLVVGGVCYTVGVAFFLMDRVRYAHAVWHFFVLGGSLSHFFAVFYGVVPSVS